MLRASPCAELHCLSEAGGNRRKHWVHARAEPPRGNRGGTKGKAGLLVAGALHAMLRVQPCRRQRAHHVHWPVPGKVNGTGPRQQHIAVLGSLRAPEGGDPAKGRPHPVGHDGVHKHHNHHLVQHVGLYGGRGGREVVSTGDMEREGDVTGAVPDGARPQHHAACWEA